MSAETGPKPLPEPQARTIAVYDARAADYARLASEMPERRELEAFAAALPRGARVLDLGCGPGFHARFLAEQGFEVDAVDASAEMVALAAAQPGVRARQAGFEELDASASYDGIWANFSLLHAPRDDMPALLARLHRALRPGGLLHLGLKLGEGEGTDALGRFYTYYTEAELEALLAAAGFTVLSRHKAQGTGLSGQTDHYLTVLCHG